MKRTEFTQPWLDALRSGEYEQGRASIFCNGQYCCIGVAAHLIDAIDLIDSFGGNDAYGQVKEKFCMSEAEMWSLIHRNDGVGGQRSMTFPEIADEIEKMLEPA